MPAHLCVSRQRRSQRKHTPGTMVHSRTRSCRCDVSRGTSVPIGTSGAERCPKHVDRDGWSRLRGSPWDSMNPGATFRAGGSLSLPEHAFA